VHDKFDANGSRRSLKKIAQKITSEIY